MRAPDSPLATWAAVDPWRCGWYQNVPDGWSKGMFTSYSNLVCGAMLSRTLSLLPLGETCSPWKCMLTVLKHSGPGTGQSAGAGQVGSFASSAFVSNIRTVSPGLVSITGPVRQPPYERSWTLSV